MDTSTPPPSVSGPDPVFAGRTPSKASAIRAGMVLGTALVVVIGAAVAMGAGSRSTSSTGANPVGAAASGSPEPGREKGPKNGNGFGHGGFGPFGGFGPIVGLGGGPGKAFGRGMGGVTVTAIDGSSVSLTTEDGWTRTIQVTSTTTITRGGAAATPGDLHVGDQIRFRQQRNEDGTYAITAIEVVLPTILGTIESTADGAITMTDRDGATVTVHLGTATKIRVRGVDDATAKDLAKGQVVIVVGERRADGSIDATGVVAGKLGQLRPDRTNRDRPKPSGVPGASPQAG